ncbi:FAD-binding oxidoreductase [Bacteriovoracaceae bacterium]|nr:FAD-binding oxidoreductase [Bacteriovoracaceae bacterium]
MKKYDYIIVGNGISGNFLAHHLLNYDSKLKILIIFDDQLIPASELNAGFFTMGSFSFLEKIYNEKPWLISILQENVLAVKKLAKSLSCTIIEKGSLTIVDYPLTSKVNEFFDSFEYLKEKDSWGKINGVYNSIDFSANPKVFLNSFRKFNQQRGVEYLSKSILPGDSSLSQGKRVLFATNGFTQNTSLNKFGLAVQPQRAQIQEISVPTRLGASPNIYHPEHRIYFRFIENKMLIGGLRTLDSKNENTTEMEVNEKIQTALFDYATKFLDEKFSFPSEQIKINNQWSGIMGFTSDELPVVKSLEKNAYYIGGFSGHGNGFSYWLTRELIYFLNNSNKSSQYFKHFYLK